jgi:hypothetical protein
MAGGRFDNVGGALLPFSRLTVIYAENGRGKTTSPQSCASSYRPAHAEPPQAASSNSSRCARAERRVVADSGEST